MIKVPENLTTKSGSLVQLHCIAEGSPVPVITWFKDGNSVIVGPRTSFVEDGKLTIVFF